MRRALNDTHTRSCSQDHLQHGRLTLKGQGCVFHTQHNATNGELLNFPKQTKRSTTTDMFMSTSKDLKVKCIDLWKECRFRRERDRAVTYIDFKKREKTQQQRRQKQMNNFDKKRCFLTSSFEDSEDYKPVTLSNFRALAEAMGVAPINSQISSSTTYLKSTKSVCTRQRIKLRLKFNRKGLLTETIQPKGEIKIDGSMIKCDFTENLTKRVVRPIMKQPIAGKIPRHYATEKIQSQTNSRSRKAYRNIHDKYAISPWDITP